MEGNVNKIIEILKTLENINENKRYVCEHCFPELTSLCPSTDNPDFYTIKFIYEPDKKIIELKSLRIYLSKYRNVRILHEELINKILEDFIKIVSPNWIFLELKVNIRGGIGSTIKRYWDKNEGDLINKAIKGL